jgi:hypothetical protein
MPYRIQQLDNPLTLQNEISQPVVTDSFFELVTEIELIVGYICFEIFETDVPVALKSSPNSYRCVDR